MKAISFLYYALYVVLINSVALVAKSYAEGSHQTVLGFTFCLYILTIFYEKFFIILITLSRYTSS
jgi:hypothetical protein